MEPVSLPAAVDTVTYDGHIRGLPLLFSLTRFTLSFILPIPLLIGRATFPR